MDPYPRTGAETLVRTADEATIPAQALAPVTHDDRWLDLNSRILTLAADPRTPLLERLRFLALLSEHLDESFMGGLENLRRRTVHDFVAGRDAVLDDVQAALAAAGIRILDWDQVSRGKQAKQRKLFLERICPVLTPLAVDPAHPFPRVSGLSLNLAVLLRDHDFGGARFACVEIPPLMPRFLSVGDLRFVRLEEVVSVHLAELFPGLDVVEARCFRVTRHQTLEPAGGADLVIDLERKLLRRRFGPAVRLEIEHAVSRALLELLVRELEIDPDAVYYVHNPLAMGPGMWTIPSVFPQT